MRYLLFYISVYNFVFPIRLLAVPKFEWLILSIPLIYVGLNFNKNKFFFQHKRYQTTLIYVLVLSLIGYVSSLIYMGDFISVMVFMKFFLMIIIANSILIWGFNIYGENFIQKIFKILVISALIISITNILEFFIPSFKAFLFKVIAVTGNSSYDISYRTHGFASGGGASLSLGILVLSLISYFKYTISKNSISRIFYFIAFIFIYLSNIIIGRTGLFLGAPIIIYLLVFKNLSIFNVFKKGLTLAILSFCIVSIISTIDEKLLNVLYKYGLEPIYNYVNYGSFQSKTTTGVLNMYFVPDILHLFTGAGFWRWPTNGYPLPDPGYMKLLTSTGIFGFIIFYVYQFIIYFETFKFFKKRYNLKVLFFFLFSILFIAEFKEAVFAQNYAFKVFALLITFSWFNNNYNNLCHKKE